MTENISVPAVSTTQSGAPVTSDAHSRSVGADGAIILTDHYLIEKLAQFNRERVPERVVHAKGGGAFTWLMLGSITFNYWMAIAVHRAQGTPAAGRRLALAVAVNLRGDLARPDADPDCILAAPAREPACGDARSVSRQLGGRAIRVPDHDLGLGAVRGDDLEDPVRADAEVVVADAPDVIGRQGDGQLCPLNEQVVVAETVPFRQFHPRARPEGAGRGG